MDLSKEFTDSLGDILRRMDADLEYGAAITEYARLADAEVSGCRATAIEQVLELQMNSFARGVIPLSTLLDIMSLDGALLGRKPSPARLKRDELVRREEYEVMLTAIKDGIRSGALTVRALGTLAPANTIPAVARWCATSDTLKTFDEMAPPSRIVVKGGDAVVWLTSLGIPVPTWLEALDNVRPGDQQAAEQGQRPAVEQIPKESPGQRRERLLLAIEQGVSKKDLCKKENIGQRRLNQLLALAKKDRASQNSKYTAILGK